MTDCAATFLQIYARRIRQPGESAAEARERARAELPTLAEGEPERETLRVIRAV